MGSGIGMSEYTDYSRFAEEWGGSETETRMVWQLLGQLGDEEVLVKIPKWLAEENTGYVSGSIPRVFIGRIEAESEKAIRLAESADAKSLMKLAHRIHKLEQSDDDADRDEWLERKLREHRREFESRADAIPLKTEWLPESQLEMVARRG
jgi:hypothetical protein